VLTRKLKKLTGELVCLFEQKEKMQIPHSKTVGIKQCADEFDVEY